MKFFDLKAMIFLALIYCHAAVAGFYPINGGMVNQSSVITSAGGTTTLVVTSNQLQVIEGSSAQTLELPDATLLPLEWWYEIANKSTGDVTVNDDAGNLIATLGPRQVTKLILKARLTAAGTWNAISYVGVDASGTIPTNAATADALAATPAPCASGEYVEGIEANGDGICQPLPAAITALTGDGTASGPGSAALTLATVNGDVGTFTNATVTVDEKGRVTAVSSGGSGGDAGDIGYTPTTESDWPDPDPTNVEEALDDLAPRVNAAQDAADAAQGDIDDHIADTSAAHAASAISNTPSGNLTATDVQGALDELQTEIDGISGGGTGDVVGPASSTDNAIARFHQTTGKIIQNSGVTVSDGDVVTASGFSGPLTGNADTATELAANPSDCSANNYATSIAANGDLTCGQVSASAGITGTLPVANGGTGQSSYTDGQLLIGNSSGNTLTKATLTQGTGITITNGNGSITIAASGGGGGTTSTEWTSYTPTLSAAFGSATNIRFRYRRIGDTLEVEGTFTAGTIAGSNLGTFTLPSSLTIDTTKIAINSTTSGPGHVVGWVRQGFSASILVPILAATSTSDSLVYLGGPTTTTNWTTPDNSINLDSSQIVSVEFSLPISGWTNNN